MKEFDHFAIIYFTIALEVEYMDFLNYCSLHKDCHYYLEAGTRYYTGLVQRYYLNLHFADILHSVGAVQDKDFRYCIHCLYYFEIWPHFPD